MLRTAFRARVLPALVVLGVGSVAAVASAAPVNYNESTDGDLKTYDGVLPTFTLDSGVNLISGTISFDGVNQSDYDSFAFVVPSNLSVVGGSIALNETDGTAALASNFWVFSSDSTEDGSSTRLAFYAVQPGLPVTLPALTARTYDFSNTGRGFTNGARAFTANYTFTLVVAPVPEPAALGGLAAAGLLLSRRRRA